MSDEAEKGRGWVLAIAIFRVVKAVLLIAASIGALALLERDLPALGESVATWLDVDRGHAAVEAILRQLPFITDRMLLGAGVGGLLYATLFLVEAYGLFRRRVWAEWLTIVATTSFIPLEVYELTKSVTPLKVAAIVTNVAIVAYLVYRRLGHTARRPQRYTRSRGAALSQST